jgi:hypothetical protein
MFKEWRKDTGSVTAELVMVCPILIIFFLVLIVGGNLEKTMSLVEDAARAGAQTAALQGNSYAAEIGAREAVGLDFRENPEACVNGETVSVDLSQFRPGGWVSVTVGCEAKSFGLLFPGISSTKYLTYTASFPISKYTEVN